MGNKFRLVFDDGEFIERNMEDFIRGIRNSKMDRPTKVVFNFNKDTELTRREEDYIHNFIIPSLHPMKGGVVEYDSRW